MTDRPGPVTSFVASPAARRRAAKGGSPASTSKRCYGSTPRAGANRGTKRGRGHSRPDSQIRTCSGPKAPVFRQRFSGSPAASRAVCRRSPRSSGRAMAPPMSPVWRTPERVASNSGQCRLPSDVDQLLAHVAGRRVVREPRAAAPTPSAVDTRRLNQLGLSASFS